MTYADAKKPVTVETDDHGTPVIVDATGKTVRRVIGSALHRDRIAHELMTEINWSPLDEKLAELDAQNVRLVIPPHSSL